MRTGHCLCLALAAGLFISAAAHAQQTTITIEASTDSGATWSRDATVPSGSTFWVRIRARLSGATALGLAGFTMQPTLTNFVAASGFIRQAFTSPGLDSHGTPTSETAYDGRHVSPGVPTNTGRMFPFGAAGQGETSASGTLTSFVDQGNVLRFAGDHATTPDQPFLAWGVGISQLPPSLAGAAFDASLDATVFRYAVTTGTYVGSYSALASVPLSTLYPRDGTGGPSVYWYTDAHGAYVRTSVTLIEAATIHGVPAPGSILALGGLLCMGRRRR